jgi:hypothetical protein
MQSPCFYARYSFVAVHCEVVVYCPPLFPCSTCPHRTAAKQSSLGTPSSLQVTSLLWPKEEKFVFVFHSIRRSKAFRRFAAREEFFYPPFDVCFSVCLPYMFAHPFLSYLESFIPHRVLCIPPPCRSPQHWVGPVVGGGLAALSSVPFHHSPSGPLPVPLRIPSGPSASAAPHPRASMAAHSAAASNWSPVTPVKFPLPHATVRFESIVPRLPANRFWQTAF